MPRSKRAPLAVLFCFCLSGAAAFAASPTPGYSIEILPSLEAGGEELPAVAAMDLSDAGFVTGRAGSGDRVAAFLYTGDSRMLNADPGGGAASLGWLVNDLGQVYLESFSPPGKFLFSEADGAVSLRQALPEAQEGGRMFVQALNNTGVLIAYVSKTPMLYSHDTGWVDATELHPELAIGEVTIENLNDRGDLVFRRGLGQEPGSQFNRIENLVLQPSGDLLSFGTEGPLVLQLGRPNEAGQITGAMVDLEESLRAFLWTPQGGVEQIEVPGAIQAIGSWTPLRNVVGGQARFEASTKGFDTLFVHSVAAGGPEFIVPKSKFKRLAKKSGFKKKIRDVQAFQLNERLEFIGEVLVKRRGRIPFVYRPDDGLFAIQRIVDAAGADFNVLAVIDLNRHGQILIGGKSGGRSTAAILTPFEELR